MYKTGCNCFEDKASVSSMRLIRQDFKEGEKEGKEDPQPQSLRLCCFRTAPQRPGHCPAGRLVANATPGTALNSVQYLNPDALTGVFGAQFGEEEYGIHILINFDRILCLFLLVQRRL